MIDYKAEREKFQREQETWSFCLLFSPKMKGGQKLPHQVAAAETQLLGLVVSTNFCVTLHHHRE